MQPAERMTDLRALSVATDVVSRVCALPAVATHDWCEMAASAIRPMRQNSVISISLAVLGDRGRVELLEATGATGNDPNGRPIDGHSLHPEHSPSLDWWFDERPQPGVIRVERLSSLPSAQNWPATPCAKRWGNLGISDPLIGWGGMLGETQGRALIIEFGVRSMDRPLEAWEVSVIRAMMPHFVQRASLAFGQERSTPANRLTQREQLVLEHLTLGKSVKQIASDLARSPHTVHDHVKALHRKLNASSRGELIARALGHVTTVKGEAPKPVGQIGFTEAKIPSLMSA